MGREVKLTQTLVLSTDVWTPGPFDQISILRRNKFGGPPPHPGSQGTEMRSVRKCLRNWVSVDKHHHISLLQASKACKGTQSVTQDYLHSTPLNNTNPSPTLHTHQYHSLPSHNSPSHTNNTTHHPPTKMSLPQPPPSLSSLPEELSALIIQALPFQALAALSQTNRKFHRLCDWKLDDWKLDDRKLEWFNRIMNSTLSDPWMFSEKVLESVEDVFRICKGEKGKERGKSDERVE